LSPFAEFGESSVHESALGGIVAGEWMSFHHRPINAVGHVFKDGGSVAVLKPLEDFANSSDVTLIHLSPLVRQQGLSAPCAPLGF
jgi:hypothetical protein